MKDERGQRCELVIEFLPRGDRQGQAIVLVSADRGRTVLLESVEGSSADDWPASPPLQSLSVEERQEGRVALLVGSAGGSHWSASVEMPAERTKLLFDVACRHSGPPQWLGSQYRRLGEPLPGLMITAEGASVEVDGSLVVIKPAEKRPSGTTRWRYSIALAEG